MLNEIMLTFAVCIDTYLVAVNYGARKIKIPILSAITISLFGAAMLFAALIFSNALKMIIPEQICSSIGVIALTSIGLITIFKSILRGVVKKLSEKGDICIKMSSIGLGIQLYLDDTCADIDSSKDLSIREAIALAAALSLDSAATGINIGFMGINVIRTSLVVFLVGTLAVWLGVFTGKRLSQSKHDFSWLGGVMLIALAFIN